MRWPARWRRPVRFVGDVGILALLGYLGVVAYLYAYQVDLVFRPPTHGSLSCRERRPRARAGRRHRRARPGHGGVARPGVTARAERRRRRAGYWILFLHGNAASISSSVNVRRYDQLRQLGLNVLAVEYPGFGDVGGTASEAGMHAAARAAYDRLRRIDGVPASHIAIYGWSLGTGAAVPLARDVDEAALIVEGGFTSVLARAGRAASVHARPLAAAASLQVRRGDRRHAQRDALPAQPGRHDHPLPARRGDVRQGRRAEAPGAPRAAATSTRTPRTPTATARPSTTS